MARDLPTLEDARRIAAANAVRLGAELVDLAQALGRISAGPVAALEPLPGFDNSAMDGYAVRAADTTAAPATLPLTGESRAGHPAGRALEPGTAIRISTGAALPDGADAVVRVELTRPAGEGVEVLEAVSVGRDVRRRGEEAAAGEALVPEGTRLGPVELGALAAAAVERVECRRRARVAILVTGDELTGAGDEPAPGCVRDSNRTMLGALVRAAGAEVGRSSMAGDDEDTIAAALVEAMVDADLVVICGGMSVGRHDHVRPALASVGVTLQFAGVELAPGRPAAFGLSPSGGPVLGLPGNPLSALVAFRLLAEPALGLPPREVAVALAEDVARHDTRTRAIPCRLTAAGAEPLTAAGHGPAAALGGDGLALISPGEGAAAAGEPVPVALL